MFLAVALAPLALSQEAPPIVNGSTTTDYEAVGVLYAANQQGYGYPFCSATLIHSEWVITAAHCAEAFAEASQYGYPYILFVVGDSLYSQTGIYDYAQIDESYIPQNYNPNTTDHDIALCHLYEPMTSVEPIALRTSTLNFLDGNDDVTLVGWGITSGNSQNSSGTKRTVDVPVYGVDGDKLYTWDQGGGQTGNACSGDSGGAALLWDGDVPVLAGAMSYVFYGTNQDYCSGGTASTRVDTHLDWIESYVDFDEPEPEPEPEDTGNNGGNNGNGNGNGNGSGNNNSGGNNGDDTGLDTGDTGFDTGIGDTGGGNGGELLAGCGCTSTSGSQGTTGLFVALLGLVVGRRRRFEK